MALSAGQKLGPYEIVAPIGAGGMGEVYRARDSRLNRDVAIKVLPEHLARDPQALARFEREAKAVAALSHPNILVLFDIGAQDGIDFAVTELLEGETLRDRLTGAALPWRKGADLGAAIAEGLAAAHSKGIIHRDLKPANIFLTADGRVKILDFGLARQRGAVPQNDETATLTEDSGSVMGTIGYMSPEQVRGAAVEASSDIFSLGCVLYEMVAGRKAFSGSTASDTLASILKEEPPALADTGKVIPVELQRVIERCLAKNPAQRFHSAHDLAFALRSLLTGTADIPSAEPRTRTSPRAILAVTAALVVGAAAGLWYWKSHAAQSIDSLAVLPFSISGGGADSGYLSDGITESLMDSLSQVPNLKVMSRNAVFRYKDKNADPRVAGRELGVRAVLTGRIVERGDSLAVSVELVDVADNSHLWGEQYNRKLADALAVQNDIAARISDKLRLRLTSDQKTRIAGRQTGNPEAYQLYLKGRYYESKAPPEPIEKGLAYFRQAIELDPNYALAYAGIAFAYNWSSDWYTLPTETMPKAKEAARKALELDDNLAEAHVEMGTVSSWYDYDWSTAEREYRRALELNPNYAAAHEFYGAHLVLMGRFEESLAQSRQAQALDPLSPEIVSLTAWELYFARRFDQAVAENRKCLDLDPNYWGCIFYLAQAYEQTGHYSEAMALLQKIRGGDDSTLTMLAEVVRVNALLEKRDAARHALEELLARSKKQYVSGYIMATVYAALGDKEQAFASLERAFPQRSFFLVLLKVDPELDSLRSDPRFQAMLRRMNFPQ